MVLTPGYRHLHHFLHPFSPFEPSPSFIPGRWERDLARLGKHCKMEGSQEALCRLASVDAALNPSMLGL